MSRALGSSVALAVLLASGRALAQADAQAQQDDGITPHPTAAIAPPDAGPGARGAFSFRQPWGWAEQGPRLDVSGYLLPQFELVSLPSALPRDTLQYGARGTRAGFAIYGTPVPNWSYIAHFVLIPAGTESLTLLSPTAAPTIGVSLPTATQTSLEVEEATLAFRAAPWWLLKAGVVRMPFSFGQTTTIPSQMFPFRAPQTTEFQNGADAGGLAQLAFLERKLHVDVGAFVGGSLGAATPGQAVRGPALVASVSAHPLGEMSLREGDEDRGPMRVAFGFASIYRHASSFDPTGYEASQFDDTRITGWVRAAYQGAYVQGEILRRLRTDDVSGRPDSSVGGYAEGSYFQPVGGVGFGPMLRYGVVTTGRDFAPRKFTSFEIGLAFFPHGAIPETEKLRILAEYLRASTSPLDEVENEGLVQLQLEL